MKKKNIFEKKIIIFSLIFIFYCHPSFASEKFYELKIKPLFPEGEIQSATCAQNYPTCYLTLVFPPKSTVKNGKNTYIDVLAKFSNDVLIMNFMINKEILTTSAVEKDYFHETIEEVQLKKHTIKLYVLNPAVKKDFDVPAVNKPQNIFLGAVEVELKPTEKTRLHE